MGVHGSAHELLHDCVVHELHALTLPRDNDILEFLRGSFADDRRHRAVHDENFIHRDPAFSVLLLHEKLGDDPSQRGGKHRANLRLLVARENVDHAVHCLAGVVRVQGSKDQQTGLGSGEREGNRLQITHFTHEHDVSVLTQGGFQADGK